MNILLVNVFKQGDIHELEVAKVHKFLTNCCYIRKVSLSNKNVELIQKHKIASVQFFKYVIMVMVVVEMQGHYHLKIWGKTIINMLRFFLDYLRTLSLEVDLDLKERCM